MIVLILVEVMFITLSVLFFMGKGKNLIAGYNTMSKEEKEKYDEKKLLRSMGFMALICAVMTGAMAIFGYLVEKGVFKEGYMIYAALLFVAVIVITTIFIGRYINKNAKK